MVVGSGVSVHSREAGWTKAGQCGNRLLHLDSNLEEVVVFLFAGGNLRPAGVVKPDLAECPVGALRRLRREKFRRVGNYGLAVRVEGDGGPEYVIKACVSGRDA